MMKKSFLLILFILIGFTVTSQFSEKYVELTKNLKPVDSITEIKKYRNGNLRKTTELLVYEHEDYVYTIYSGKRQFYRKDGSIHYEMEYDRFGTLLKEKRWNKSGELIFLIEYYNFDVLSNSIENFLNTFKILSFSFKEYSMTTNNELSLWREGHLSRLKRIGTWKTYKLPYSDPKIKNYNKSKK